MRSDEIPLKRISELAVKIGSMLYNDQIIEFIKIIEEKGFIPPTSKDMTRLNLSPSNRDRLKRYFKEIKGKAGLVAISASLLGLAKIKPQIPIEICWTGPSDDTHIRLTWSVISEIILSAENNILLTGYAINTNMEKIMDYLEEKSRLGVRLVFMIDRLEEKEDFLQWAKRLPQPPELYSKPKDPNDPMSALHVKCIVVDERIAMFGSANLTYHGMKSNIELGIVLRDERSVKKIVNLLSALRKQLLRIELSTL